MSLFDIGLGGIGSALLGYTIYDKGKDSLNRFAQDAQAGQQQAWEQFAPQFQFKPFTVTTGTGATAGYQDGALTMQGGAQDKAMQDLLFQQAQQQYQAAGQPIGQATQGYYDQMMAAQQPQMDRNRLAMEERLAAQGRLGLSSAAYGGANPEQLAMAQAQQEMQSKNYLAARQAALGEQQQAANLGSSMFTQAYLPQAQQLNAFGAAQNAAQMEQQAMQQYGTTGMQSYLTGLDAMLQANLGKANLTGNYLTTLAEAFKPTINPKTGEAISGTGLFGDLKVGDIYDPQKGWFSGLGD